MSASTRFPSALYSHGTEPDPRFTLANERTFLAWIRTSLAFLAAGIALEALGLGLNPGIRLASSLLFVTSGTVIPLCAWINWARTERALRLQQVLPSSTLGIVLGVITVASGLLLVLAMLTA